MVKGPLEPRRVLAAAALALVVSAGSGCASSDGGEEAAAPAASVNTEATLAGVTIDVKKDPGCGCCTSWVQYLEAHGATVKVTEDADRDAFRAARQISDAAASCHTGMVSGYAIEGHVPAGAIQRLLSEQPEAAGLALPGMPSDSPGMGGNQSTWDNQAVMLVGDDGGLTTFEY